MIAYIEGIVVHITDKFIVVNTGNLGYKIFTSIETITTLSLNEQVSFWVYTAVRENSIDLYGFLTKDEESFFELLLNVSGVGPKSAISILTVAPLNTLKRAIAEGDTIYLNKVSGIGKKTAEKIIVELRDKLQSYKTEDGKPSSLRDEKDVVEALKSLGYTQNEAREALNQVPSSIEGTNARIKEALRILANRR